jgi:hypothetical protein
LIAGAGPHRVGHPSFRAPDQRIRFLAMDRLAPRPLMAFGLLFLVLVGFLAATFSYRRITDTELNSFQTRALVLHGDVDLDRYERVNQPAFFTHRADGHLYSL